MTHAPPRYYTVDLRLRPDTLAQLDAAALSLDMSIQGFVVRAVAEYLQRKGFAVVVPATRRRYRDQTGNTAGTSIYRNSETPKEVKPLSRRTIFFPNDWRGVFARLYIRDHVDSLLAVRAATAAKLETMKGAGIDTRGTAIGCDSMRGAPATGGSRGAAAT